MPRVTQRVVGAYIGIPQGLLFIRPWDIAYQSKADVVLLQQVIHEMRALRERYFDVGLTAALGEMSALVGRLWCAPPNGEISQIQYREILRSEQLY